MEEFRGKVVLLDFWATWCGPCADSLPVYDAWQRELSGREFSVLAVSVDEASAPVADFARRLAPSVVVLRDAGGHAAAELDLPTMPTSFLIAQDGRWVAEHAGFSAEDADGLKREILTLLHR